MIVDAALVIDAVADPGSRGVAARAALAAVPSAERLLAPGHLAFEVMSGLGAAANRPNHPLQPAGLGAAVRAAASLEISIEGTPWADVERAWTLAGGSLRYADAIYVAAAERHGTARDGVAHRRRPDRTLRRAVRVRGHHRPAGTTTLSGSGGARRGTLRACCDSTGPSPGWGRRRACASCSGCGG